MPQFSARKRAFIQEKLIRTAAELFAQSGVRKTAIDRITAATGIAKGSFYAFYSSKEHLYTAVLADVHRSIAAELTAGILSGSASPDESAAGMLKAAAEIPKRYPETADYFLTSLRDEVEQIAQQEGMDPGAAVPLPDFQEAAAYWRDRKMILDVEPPLLQLAAEVLVRAHFENPDPARSRGAALLAELAGVGISGYVRRLA